MTNVLEKKDASTIAVVWFEKLSFRAMFIKHFLFDKHGFGL